MRLFQAEWLKLRRSNVIGVIIGFPLLTVVLIALLQMFIVHVAQSPPVHPRVHFTAAQIAAQDAARAKIVAAAWSWKLLFSLSLRVWAIFMFPIMAMAVATIVSQAEHSTRAWSYALSLRTAWWQVYGAKAIFILLAVAGSAGLLGLMLLGAGEIHTVSGHPYNDSADVRELFTNVGLVLMGGFWMVALQAWAGLRFQSMIPLVMLSAGLIVIEIAGMIAAPMIGPEKDWMMFIPSITPYATLSHVDAWVNAKWVGLTGGGICLGLMILHLSRREVP
ncbi:MAG TPA: hypothetical protein VG839_08795 [Asticcacaulis sp.]|nr:hypothetical protein [Asticcacaulis sp.]